ncbi:hypothetical protein DI272_07160 [Streptomyces sp. Act143]|uniref:hypothetical protein n=1 Tax=Streptomyces sp. Act143 TaxID=2200760 RepID=UPI000D675850|nr:hypothetical protein [Streptomyces sp. Act143]PWI13957.1 hypothetical protein DI272_07160 [Streptomyces sp. Act143]
MFATEGSTVPELEHHLRLFLWLLPITAVLCAAFCVSSLGAMRRSRAAGEAQVATAKGRNATATALLAAFLAAAWGAAALLIR